MKQKFQVSKRYGKGFCRRRRGTVFSLLTYTTVNSVPKWDSLLLILVEIVSTWIILLCLSKRWTQTLLSTKGNHFKNVFSIASPETVLLSLGIFEIFSDSFISFKEVSIVTPTPNSLHFKQAWFWATWWWIFLLPQCSLSPVDPTHRLGWVTTLKHVPEIGGKMDYDLVLSGGVRQHL